MDKVSVATFAPAVRESCAFKLDNQFANFWLLDRYRLRGLPNMPFKALTEFVAAISSYRPGAIGG